MQRGQAQSLRFPLIVGKSVLHSATADRVGRWRNGRNADNNKGDLPYYTNKRESTSLVGFLGPKRKGFYGGSWYLLPAESLSQMSKYRQNT